MWDFVGPQWSGRVVSYDPYGARGNASGQVSFVFDFVEPGQGLAWLDAFFAMDIAFAPNDATALDWVAQGAYAICLVCSITSGFDRLAALGLPIGNIEDKIISPGWKDPRILFPGGAGGNYLSAVDKVPHPNARKLFLNWFLTKEGQTAMHVLADPDSPTNPTLRADVTERGNSNPIHWRDPNLEYVALSEIPGFSYEASQQRAIDAYNKYYGIKEQRR